MPRGPARAQSILRLAIQHGWRRGVELGVWEGATSGYLLSALPGLELIGVDRWERTPGPPKSKETGECDYSQKDMEGAEAKVRALQAEHGGRFVVLKQDTVSAAEFVADASMDFVFVDAYHSTAAVYGDVIAWLPKIRPGGALLGHDADWPSVQRALDQLGMSDHALLEGNVWLRRVSS